VLIPDVGLDHHGIRDARKADGVQLIEQRVFVRYGQQDQAVRSVMPPADSLGMFEAELERSMSSLGRL